MIDAEYIQKRVFEILDNDFQVFYAQEEPPQIKVIDDFQNEIGTKFPDDFLPFITTYWNGFYAEADQEVWPEVEGGAYWMFQYGLLVFGLDSGIPEWANMRDFVNVFRDDYQTNLTPCMKTRHASETYCFDDNGDLFLLSHETWKAEKVDSTFFEAFEEELKKLQANKEKAKAELL